MQSGSARLGLEKALDTEVKERAAYTQNKGKVETTAWVGGGGQEGTWSR